MQWFRRLLILPRTQKKEVHCCSVLMLNYDTHVDTWNSSGILPILPPLSVCSQMVETREIFPHLSQPDQPISWTKGRWTTVTRPRGFHCLSCLMLFWKKSLETQVWCRLNITIIPPGSGSIYPNVVGFYSINSRYKVKNIIVLNILL